MSADAPGPPSFERLVFRAQVFATADLGAALMTGCCCGPPLLGMGRSGTFGTVTLGPGVAIGLTPMWLGTTLVSASMLLFASALLALWGLDYRRRLVGPGLALAGLALLAIAVVASATTIWDPPGGPTQHSLGLGFAVGGVPATLAAANLYLAIRYGPTFRAHDDPEEEPPALR